MPVTAAVSVTAAAAAAVAEAVETVSSKKAGIKWVNDVLTDNKKVCGILTEAALDVESGALSYAVLGIGVNVYPPQGGFPEDIKNKAGALCDTKQPGLKNRLAAYAVKNERTIVTDLFSAGDIVILVTPIDEAAPKGRLILPEQLVLRELLDIHALPLVVQETELAAALISLKTPPKNITVHEVPHQFSPDQPPPCQLAAVVVAQLARQGDRDDLHVVVRVRAETFPARHRVVVQHAQRTEMNPLRVVVIRKAECV